MRTGHCQCLCSALVCLAVAGFGIGLHADDNPFPHLRYHWKIPAHSNGITRAILFTPDGAQLISAGDDGNVNFFRRSDGGYLTNFTAHRGSIYGLALSTDGRLLASGGQDGLLKIWDVTAPALVRSFLAHTTMVASVAFSPDGTLLASAGGPDNLVKLWRVADGQLVRTITSSQPPSTWPTIRSVAFSPDGRYIAGSGLEMWSVDDGSLVRASSVGGDDDVKFSPDGSRLTIQEHYMVWVINLATGNLERVPSVNWRPWSAFSPDGASLFTISFVGDAVWADFRRRTVITNYTCDHGWCTDRYSSISFDPQMRALGLGTEAGEVILAKLPLWISNIERAGNNLTIQWQGGTGPFQLQGIREITSSTWEDIGPPLMGSTVSLPIDAASAIYRVRDLRP